MKLSTQLAVVIVVGILGYVALVIGLAVFADWSDGAIIGFSGAFGAIIINTIIAVRNQAKTVERLADQDQKLDTVVAQTNGLSEIERNDVAERAAISVVRQLRGPAAAAQSKVSRETSRETRPGGIAL